MVCAGRKCSGPSGMFAGGPPDLPRDSGVVPRDGDLHWDPDCLVQGPNSWISPKIDKGRSKYYWGQNDYMLKNCFEQLIFELHRITVHPFLFARINFRL